MARLPDWCRLKLLCAFQGGCCLAVVVWAPTKKGGEQCGLLVLVHLIGYVGGQYQRSQSSISCFQVSFVISLQSGF